MSVAVTLPTSSVIFRKAFHSANKQTNETVDDWYHRLQDLAQPCNYGCYLEVLLLEKLIVGLDETILNRLYTSEQQNLSIRNVIEFTRSVEVDNEQIDIVSRLLTHLESKIELNSLIFHIETRNGHNKARAGIVRC